MAFSRRTNFRRRTFSRVPRRRPLRPAKETQRWETCNLWLENDFTIPNLSANTTTQTAVIARISTGLWDSSTATGRSLANATRGLELGGIVLQYGIDYDEPTLDLETAVSDGACWSQFTLYYDRLIANGVPAATPAWDSAQTPFASSPPGTGEDIDFPMRVLHRDTRRFDMSTVSLINPAEGTLYAVNGQVTRGQRTGSLNKRLKGVINDDQALCFSSTIITSAGYAAGINIAVKWWFSGTLYYRARF